MLSWGEPGAFWFGLILLPIIIFYFLRMRFRRQPISSIYIWSRLKMTSRGANKLRWWSVLLLIFQVLAGTAAVITLALPGWVTQRLEHPGMVYILDVSASMGATDLGGSRLETAKTLLMERINNLSSDTPVMIYLVASDTKSIGNASVDHRALLSKLETVKCANGSFDEEKAAKILKTWLVTENRPWQGCLITDGGLDLHGKKLSSVFDGMMDIVTVGSHGHNLGLSGLRLLPDAKYRFLVHNGWSTEKEIKIRLEREGEPVSRNETKVPPGSSVQTVQIKGGFDGLKTGAYTLILEENNDVFPLDDRTYLAVNRERIIRVLLVGGSNPFIMAALNNPGILVEKVRSLSEPERKNKYDEWDLIVVDRMTIPPAVNTNILTFGSLPPDSPVKFGSETMGSVSEVDSAHPLLRFIDWQSTRVNFGKSLVIEENVQELATINGEPLIVAWEKEGRHVIACGTTLFTSELGLSGAFPIFLQNILRWCVPQMNNPLAYTLSAGQPGTYAEPISWRVREKNTLHIERIGRYLTVVSDLPGVYHWEKNEGTNSRHVNGVLAINISGNELDIAPRVLPIKKTELRVGTEYSKKGHSLVQWSLILLLGCLCLEWVLWRGGWPLRTVKQS